MGSAGSSILSSSNTRESRPGAFQLCIPRIAPFVSSSVGADPSGTESPVVGAAGRCCTSSMMAGFSLGDLVLRRVLKNLAHRWRISPLSLRKTPFSSLTYCGPPDCLPPTPIDFLRCLYRPLMSRSSYIACSLVTYLSRRAWMPSSTAVHTPLHAALSDFHVAGVRLLFISRRASRRLARASSTAALVSGFSHHSGIRGIRLSVGSTVCAASRIASVNSLAASGAVAFGWPVCSPRLCRNLSITGHRDISTCNSCRLNCRCFGLARMARLRAVRPPRSTAVITMLWSESTLAGSAGWGCTTTLRTLRQCT